MAKLNSTLQLDIKPAITKIRRVETRAKSINGKVNLNIGNLSSINSQIRTIAKGHTIRLDVTAPELGTIESKLGQLDKALNVGVVVEDNGSIDDTAQELGQLDTTKTATVDVTDRGETAAIATRLSALEKTYTATVDVGVTGDAAGAVDGSGGGLLSGAGAGAVASGARAVLPVAAAGFSLKEIIDQTTEADKLLREVASLQITDFGFDDAQRVMEDFNAETRLGVVENVPGLYQALSAGVPPDNVLDFLIQSGELASAGVADLQPTIGVLSGALNAYGADAINAEDASLALFGAVQSGVTTLPELSARLGEVTPLAADLGINFTELNAAVATSTQVTGQTASTVTGLRSILAELGTSASVAGKNFEEAAGVGFRQFIEEGGTLAEGLQILQDEAASTGLGINELFGSVEAGGVALQLTREDGEAFASTMENLTGIVDDGTAVANAFAINQEGIGFQFNQVKAAAEDLVLELGFALAPVLGDIATFLADDVIPVAGELVGALTNIDDTVGDVVSTIEGLTGIDLGGVFNEAVGGFHAFVAAFQAGDGDITSSGFAGTLEAIGGALRAVGDAGIGLAEGLGPSIGSIISTAGTIAQESLPVITDIVSTVGAEVASVVEDITPAITAAGEFIAGFVADAQPLISQVVSGVGGIIGQVAGIGGSLITGVVDVADSLAPVIGPIASALLDLGEVVFPAVVVGISAVLDVIGPIVETALPALASGIDTAIEKGTELWGFLSENLGPVFVAIGEFLAPIVDEILVQLSARFDDIVTAGTAVWEVIDGPIRTAIEAAAPVIVDIVEVALVPFQVAWEAIGTAATAVWEVIDGPLTTAVGAIQGVLVDLVATALDPLGVVVDGVQAAFDLAAASIDLTWEAIDALISVGGTVIDTVLSPMEGVVDGVKSAFGFLADQIETVSDLIDQIPSISIPGADTLGSTISRAGSIIPGVSSEGRVVDRPFLTWVGEGGRYPDRREIIAPLGSMTRTVDLFEQAGMVTQLQHELARRSQASIADPTTPVVATGPPVAVAAPNITVYPPPGMNSAAAVREVRRAAQAGAERAAARALAEVFRP